MSVKIYIFNLLIYSSLILNNLLCISHLLYSGNAKMKPLIFYTVSIFIILFSFLKSIGIEKNGQHSPLFIVDTGNTEFCRKNFFSLEFYFSLYHRRCNHTVGNTSAQVKSIIVTKRFVRELENRFYSFHKIVQRT